jgi:tRNA(Ile)-lysidine synthase
VTRMQKETARETDSDAAEESGAATAELQDAVRRSLDAHVPAGANITMALSGGRDSVVLLDALVAFAPDRGNKVTAIHVHHGLSANADAWARSCVERCVALHVACEVRRVAVVPQPRASLEALARHARYDALADAAQSTGATIVALAHHRNDQAETLLLQLLRGSGPHGLAAMAAWRQDAAGIAWWRPLLGIPRARIDAYARERRLRWSDDESNADGRHARNAVRHSVMPALVRIAPQADATLARAAAHQADAARLLDELAEQDGKDACDGTTLLREALDALAPHRARNLLRWFLRGHGLPAPSTARLAAMLDQLRGARGDAVIRLAHAGIEIGVHQGRIALHRAPPARFDVCWQGESELALPHGTVTFGHAEGAGIDLTRTSGDVHLRSRAGGERFQIAQDRPRRALKSVLRDAGIPPWERSGLPLVWCGDALAAVAGLGVDAALGAGPGRPGLTVAWHPRRV